MQGFLPLRPAHELPNRGLDALAVRVREEGRIVRTACVIATAVNADGHREILGLDLFTR